MRSQRLTQLAVLILSATLFSPAPAAEISPELQKAASQAMLMQLQPTVQQGILIEIQKIHPDKHWILGSATLILPSHLDDVPETRLFMAQYIANHWRVAIEGSEQYALLLEQAPDALFAPNERKLLLHSQSVNQRQKPRAPLAEVQTGLGLPWVEGTAWRLTGGPHGDDQTSRPFNSLDFAGGNGRVLAPRDGLIYQSCLRNGSGLITLVHDNGFTSSYYHMENLTNLSNGAAVRKGTYLGNIGMGLPCGGSTTGPHVHFALKQGSNKTPVDGKVIGGWLFREGNVPYQGYASRNGKQVNVGGELLNYGGGNALPSGKVTPGNNENTVNLRQSPSLSAAIVGSLQRGEAVAIVCTSQGDWVDGVWGRTQLWNRLSVGSWISDGFIDTGSNQAVAPPC